MASREAGGRVVDLSDQVKAVSTGRILDGFVGWFGPMQPMPAVAPAEDVRGRQFDFPYAVNVNYRPRAEQSETGVSFEVLRRLSDPGAGGLDVLRLAIETRKDQMCAIPWQIAPRKVGTEQDQSDAARKRAAELTIRLRSPDGQATWSQWLRMLLEDYYVLDAVAILPRATGGAVLLELMDGAMLKRIIDNQGRTPLPPFPAYQQILKGVPSINYRSDELMYFARNQRTNRLYGLSHVEQVINTVSLALRRFLHVQEYYTSGTVPDMLLGVPESWSAGQIKEFQSWFDALLEGNTADRRKARFIPGGTAPMQLKDAILKDEFDEWLARVVCYCFALSPQTLVKEVNRATAETAAEMSKDEGLEPTKGWVKEIVDACLARSLGAPDFELAWADEEITDPKVKAEVTAILAGNKPVIDQNEARRMWGYPDKTPDELKAMTPATPDPLGMFGGGRPTPPNGATRPDADGGDRGEDDEEDDDETEGRLGAETEKVRKAAGRSLRGYAKPGALGRDH